MEIVVRLQRYLIEDKRVARIAFLPYPIAVSQAPENISDFGRQRDRWYRGLTQVLYYHRRMLFNRRYGRLGLFAMPYQFVFEFLGPLLEVAGYLSLPIFYFAGVLRMEYLLLFLTASILYGAVVSIAAVLMGLWTERTLSDGRPASFAVSIPRPAEQRRLDRVRGPVPAGVSATATGLQVRGFVGFLGGKQGWGKFRRAQF